MSYNHQGIIAIICIFCSGLYQPTLCFLFSSVPNHFSTPRTSYNNRVSNLRCQSFSYSSSPDGEAHSENRMAYTSSYRPRNDTCKVLITGVIGTDAKETYFRTGHYVVRFNVSSLTITVLMIVYMLYFMDFYLHLTFLYRLRYKAIMSPSYPASAVRLRRQCG